MVQVDWSFILGQGWLLSNHFCKACQNYTKAVRKAPANAIMQHKQRQLGQNQLNFDMLNTKFIAVQPSMAEYE